MKLRYVCVICLLFACVGFAYAESYMPESGIFAYREVENVTVNGVDFTVPTDYSETFSNDTCKSFKNGKDTLKISVVKNGTVKKVKSSRNVTSGKTMLGSVEGYLVNRNGTSFTFSYDEGGKLVVIKSNDLTSIMGVMGKDL